jgi:hypothetical protein
MINIRLSFAESEQNSQESLEVSAEFPACNADN